MKGIILLLFCIIGSTCLAQEVIVNVEFFNVEDGLSDRSIFDVTQDDRGLIWVATGNGINRYDGSEFKQIMDTSNPLSSGAIHGIQKDKFGKLWVQKPNESISLFDPLESQILPLPIDEKFRNEILETVSLNIKGKDIFLKNEVGKLFFLNELAEIVPFGDLEINGDFNIKPTGWNTVLVQKKYKKLIEEIDRSGLVKRSFELPVPYQSLYHGSGNCLRIVLSANYYPKGKDEMLVKQLLYGIEKSGELQSLDLKKDGRSMLFNELDTSKTFYLNLVKDSKKNIWLSINEKLWFFDADGNLIKDLTASLYEHSNTSDFKVNNLFIDDNDRLWVASGLGLFLAQVKENPFENYFTGVDGVSVRGIAEVENKGFLVSTYSGMKVFNEKTKKEMHISGGLTGLSVTKDMQGNFWIGSHSSEVSVINEDDIMNFDSRMEYGIRNGQDIDKTIPFYDSISGEVYVGTNNGLYIFDKECSCFNPFTKFGSNQAIRNKNIASIFGNDQGIWLATNKGIYLVDRREGVVKNFQFSHNDIKYIYEDEAGDFWLATSGGGLIHWNRKENKEKQYTVKDGLSHNVIYAVYEDRHNNLWLPSNKGLMRFQKETGVVDAFQIEDGIPHEEFNTYSHFQGSDGKLYFGGLSGLTSFFPEELEFKESEAPFMITDVQQFDFKKGQLLNKTKEVQAKNKLTLNAGDKFFTVSFSLLDYFVRNPIYAWKIDGLEEEWNYQTENSIRINALPYGNYNLLIKAKGEGGRWAKNELNITVAVLKPFYLRWEFIAFAFCLVALLIYGFVRLRIRRLEQTKEKLKGLVKERTAELSVKNKELEQANQFKDKIYSIIAHDLRGPAFALQDIGKKIDYLTKSQQFERLQLFGETVDESIATLNTLLDNLLNWARQNMGAITLHPESINVSQLVYQSIKELKLNIDKKEITVNVDIDPELYVFADRPTLLSIFRNLLSNAIKFTRPKGAIQFSAKLNTEGTIMTNVIDNGLGIERNRLAYIFDPKKNKSTIGSLGEKGTGLGLGVSKELAILNGGDIKVTSTLGEGSTFSVILPSLHL